MKATEFRLNNLIQTNQGVFKISGIQNEGLWICPFLSNESFSPKFSDIQPIPLTEEWLLKFGFLIDGEEYRLEGISIEDIHNGVKWVVYMFDEYHAVECSLAIVQHVHTLQNLYFALTNEELTIIS